MQRLRLLVAAAALLLFTSCASTLPEGASPTSAKRQIFAALFTGVTITDTQIMGVSGQAVPILAAAADSQLPGLSGVLAAVAGKGLDKLGVILPVTPQQTDIVKLLVCPPKLASECLAIRINTPVTVWVVHLAGSPDLLLIKRITS